MRSIFAKLKTLRLPLVLTALLVCVTWAVAQAPQSPPPANTGTIQGTVTTVPGTGVPEPVPGVTISLSILQAASAAGVTPINATVDATTDDMGRFTFKDLYPGRYQLRYTLAGYYALPLGGSVQASGTVLTQQTTQARSLGATIGFVLDSKQPVNLAIPLIPGGVITGRIAEPTGKAVTNAQVSALEVEYPNSVRTLTSRKTATTNDRGEYRIYGLEPGEYYVRTDYRHISPQPGAAQDLLRSYFPGVESPNAAAKVKVESGAETSGTNLTIQPTAGVKISGVVLPPASLTDAAPTPAAAARGSNVAASALSTAALYLMPEDAGELRDDYTAATNTNPSATDRNVWKFELRNIRPGHYILYALYRDNPLNGQKRHIGHVAVNVGNQDVGGVTIPISEGVELRARVTGNGDTAAQSQVPQQLTLRSRDGLPTNLQPAPQPLNAPGAGNWRVFPGLTEGNYVLDSPLVTLRDAYVADIRQGDKSIYESGTITIGSGTPDPLEVILARPAGTITGKVQSASGPATAGVRVALIPNGPRRENPMLFKRATTNADGQITLMGIAPGEYKLFAWDNIPNGAELNADFMKDYEDRGTPVTISAGASLEVVLPLIVEKRR